MFVPAARLRGPQGSGRAATTTCRCAASRREWRAAFDRWPDERFTVNLPDHGAAIAAAKLLDPTLPRRALEEPPPDRNDDDDDVSKPSTRELRRLLGVPDRPPAAKVEVRRAADRSA